MENLGKTYGFGGIIKKRYVFILSTFRTFWGHSGVPFWEAWPANLEQVHHLFFLASRLKKKN